MVLVTFFTGFFAAVLVVLFATLLAPVFFPAGFFAWVLVLFVDALLLVFFGAAGDPKIDKIPSEDSYLLRLL